MAKTHPFKIAKVLLVFGYIVVFLGLLGVEVWLKIAGSGFSVSFLIYWLVLFGWLGLFYQFGWGSPVSLISAFILFIISAALTTLGLPNAGELLMRLSFIGWMVGIVQALVEYKYVLDKRG